MILPTPIIIPAICYYVQATRFLNLIHNSRLVTGYRQISVHLTSVYVSIWRVTVEWLRSFANRRYGDR